MRSVKQVTYFGLLANVGLSLAKIAVGFIAHSRAIIADGFHSLSDLVSDLAVLWGLEIGQRPGDASHPYGHRRFHSLSAAAIGVLLVGAALAVCYNSIVALAGVGITSAPSWLAFWVAVASIAIKEYLFRVTLRAGKRERNSAVIANAWHHRSDAFSSIAAAAGIGGAILGGPRWVFLDSLTGLALGAFIAVIGAGIIRRAVDELVDRAPPPDVLRAIERVLQNERGVMGHHAFRARMIGGAIEMDVHVEVDPDLTVSRGHEIAERLKQDIMAANSDVVGVLIHIEPFGERRWSD